MPSTRGGLLPGSAELMAQAILRMTEMDARERLEMGQRARSAALDGYSMETATMGFTKLVSDAQNYMDSAR